MPLRPVLFRSASTLLLASVVGLAGCGGSNPGSAPSPGSELSPEEAAQVEWDALVEEFLAFHFYFNPVEATRLGVHDYDGRLPDWSLAGIRALTEGYRRWSAELGEIDRYRLPEEDYRDHRLLERALEARVLELEELRRWERDPSVYLELIWAGIEPLLREGGAAAVRMNRVADRERQVANLLAQARSNLQAPPPLLVELAIPRARQVAKLLRTRVPATFAGVPNGLERRNFLAVSEEAARELESFADWLSDGPDTPDLADFRLGQGFVERWFAARHHLPFTVERLLSLHDREITRYRSWLVTEAAALPGEPSPGVAIGRWIANAPPPEARAARIGAGAGAGADFVRRTGWAAPGPETGAEVRTVEDDALDGEIEVTHPGLLSPGTRTGILRVTDRAADHPALSGPGLDLLAVHWGLPGRLRAMEELAGNPSRIRRIFVPPSLFEGWGWYVEEALLDGGIGSEEHRVVQLHRALTAWAVSRAALRVHARGMTVEEAVRELQTTAWLDEGRARAELGRVLVDPAAASGILVRAQVSRLLADVQDDRAASGASFSPAEVRDAILFEGLPIELLRGVLMPGDARPSLR